MPAGFREYTVISHDLLSVGAIGIALVLAVVVLYFLRLRALIVMAITIAVGLTWTFGVTRLAIGHLNIATAFLVSIVAGNGINVGILYQARYFEERRRGLDPEAAIRNAVHATWKPTAIAALVVGRRVRLARRHRLPSVPRLRVHRGVRDDPLLGRQDACGGAAADPARSRTQTPRSCRVVVTLRDGRTDARSPGWSPGRRRRSSSWARWSQSPASCLPSASCSATRWSTTCARRRPTVRRRQTCIMRGTSPGKYSARARGPWSSRADSPAEAIALEDALRARWRAAATGDKPFVAVHGLDDLVAPDQEAKIRDPRRPGRPHRARPRARLHVRRRMGPRPRVPAADATCGRTAPLTFPHSVAESLHRRERRARRARDHRVRSEYGRRPSRPRALRRRVPRDTPARRSRRPRLG